MLPRKSLAVDSTSERTWNSPERASGLSANFRFCSVKVDNQSQSCSRQNGREYSPERASGLSVTIYLLAAFACCLRASMHMGLLPHLFRIVNGFVFRWKALRSNKLDVFVKSSGLHRGLSWMNSPFLVRLLLWLQHNFLLRLLYLWFQHNLGR